MNEVLRGFPEFPQFRDLRIEDKPVFDNLFSRFPPVISEFTFTNLFMWRHTYRTKVARFQNFLCLLSEHAETPFFFPVIGEGDMIECYQTLLRFLEARGSVPRISRVPETVAAQVNWESGGMRAEPDRGQADYVYLTQSLIQLQGRRYHRKRNHIKQFKEKYSYEYIPLTLDWIPECLRLEREWCNLRNCEGVPGLANESIAIKEFLSHFDELKVTGGAILVEGKFEAFTFGEPLNPRTVVIHIEKANPLYEGLYPIINQAFLAHHWSGYDYVNREQDLGEEGLRKAKESYFPDHMGNKYTVSLR
jgi:uncharacterized protein